MEKLIVSNILIFDLFTLQKPSEPYLQNVNKALRVKSLHRILSQLTSDLFSQVLSDIML